MNDDEKSLYNKYISGEITYAEYRNELAKRKGFGSYKEYRDWLYRKKGYAGGYAEYKRKQREKIKEESAKLLEMFEKVNLEGVDLEKEMGRPSERSEDTWGLKRSGDGYKSSFGITIIEDEEGNRKVLLG